jgi:ATP-binding cassette subfamily B protein
LLGTPEDRGRWAPLREYTRWLGPHRVGILVVFVLATVSALLSLVPPYATKWIVDAVLTNTSVEIGRRIVRLNVVGAAVLLLLIIQQSFEAWRGYRMAVLNARIVQRIRQKLYNHLLRLPLGKIYHLRTGGVVTHLSNDVDEVSSLLQMGLITPGVAGLRVVLTVVMLFYLQWKMALVACTLIPPIILVNVFWVRRIRPIYRSMRADRAAANARVAETFGGVRVVRAFQRERSEAAEYAVAQHTIIRKNVFVHVLQLVVTSGWGLLIPLCSLVVIWYGGTRYLAGETTIGSIIAFQMYIFMLLSPISQIVNSYSQLQRALACMERIYDLLTEQVDKPDRPGAGDLPLPLRSIRFDHVNFGYDPQHLVVRDLTFTVRAGQTVALVGPSGAGKTTITNLVARFYDPTAGAIFINDVDLRDIRLGSFRGPLGIVEQEVFLFDGTIRQNIAYGRRGATAEQIIAAAKRANAHEFIIGFPDGYDTTIGERGVKLSGGQRQRLSIARAILADPQILILDEATSNLDTQSEQLIQAALEDLLANRTTFVIAHRLSTIRHADLILVLQDGQIIESGEHETLMAGDTFYREMIERQMYREPYDAPATLDT